MSNGEADLRSEAIKFATNYAELWALPEASSAQQSPEVAKRAAQHYRPDEAAALMTSEMRTAIESKLGVHMTLKDLRVEIMSDTSALCWITFVFHPAEESGHKAWNFTNLYGYRAETKGVAAGFEFIMRDQEATAMKEGSGVESIP
nr:hypothetical protein CFP56_78789 [Quercus suber]